MEKPVIWVSSNKENWPPYRMIFHGEDVEYHSLKEVRGQTRNCRADLVIMDCGYDFNLGLSLLKDIKASNPSVLTIFLTDVSSEDVVRDAFRSGARDFFKKPINILELRRTVNSLLKIRKTASERRLPFFSTQGNEASQNVTCATGDKPPYLLHVIQYILENMSQRISLDECAKEANLSKYHFCRSFKRYVGMRPMEFITFLRINRAKDLLRRDDLNITEVASHVGFNDLSHFSAEFNESTEG